MEEKYTNDSRLLLKKMSLAQRCYFMYSENLVMQSDGIAYGEILFLFLFFYIPLSQAFQISLFSL